jgi:cation transport ATPase
MHLLMTVAIIGQWLSAVVRGSDRVVSFRALADAGRRPTRTPGAALLDLAPPTARVLWPGGLEQTVQVNEVGFGSRFIVSMAIPI